MSRSAEAQAEEAALRVVLHRAGAAPVAAGLVLGSGLGALADMVEGAAIPYAELPGFPEPGVSGHGARLAVGLLEGARVAVFGGRAHYYERGDAAAMRGPLALLQRLGADRLILTNAAGSLRPDIAPGDVMLIADHINFSGRNPLIGEPSEARFVDMSAAYDPGMRAEFRAAAEAEGVGMPEGVYAWYSGPSFETPAEIRALRILGADAVGMSTAPETILANFLGLRVAAMSVITNMAAGMSDEALSHEHTKAMAPIGAAKLERVLRRWLRGIAAG
jgi:purine-nucleoside phosphorylase